MVMEDTPKPRPTFVLKRGRYDMPDTSQKVEPGVPVVPAPAARRTPPRNRLGLARWLAAPANPLTARVAVNRIWQHHFGTGLVKTAENFGIQGEPPSHPELLDWLATELVRTGWDVKAHAPADRHQRDLPPVVDARRPRCSRATRRTACWRAARGSGCRPRWCATTPWRSPGCWSTQLGGPSVKPYQPAGLWEELAGGAGEAPYVQDKGPNLYRRSLYVYRKRTVPHPAMATFDAPSREICQVKRPRTNTPLQALELLNDVTYVEAAAAARPARDRPRAAPTPEDRIAFAFRRALARTAARRRAGRRCCAGSSAIARLSRRPAAAAATDPPRREPAGPAARPGRAGRLHRDRQRHPEPGRDDHARVNRRPAQPTHRLCDSEARPARRTAGIFLATARDRPGRDRPGLAARSRRSGPRRAGDRRLAAAGRRAPDGGLAGPAALPAQGEAGHLPVPVGRPVADRPVRLQAGALRARRGIELPASVRMGQRITTMTSGQKSFPVAPSLFKFAQHGQSGAWLSELLAAHGQRSPTTSASSARCRPRRSTTTRRSRSSRPARSSPAGRAWARGSPTAWAARTRTCRRSSCLLSRGRTDQPLYDRLWGSGFLPTRYQGVKLRGGKDPVLYLANPAGCSPPTRRQMLDDLAALNDLHHAETGDPEIATRVAQYELAYRMQASVPELTDLSSEPQIDPRPVRPRRAEARQLRRQLPAGPPPGRARRAVHPALSHGLGPAQRPARPDPQPVPATPTSPPPP